MSSYALTDETAIDVLIFWVESTDGSISYEEQEAVKRVLNSMQYDMKTFRKTLSHIGAMSTEHVKTLIEEAMAYIRSNFSDDGKKLTYSLLDAIAHCEGKISSEQQQKLDKIKKEFGL